MGAQLWEMRDEFTFLCNWRACGPRGRNRIVGCRPGATDRPAPHRGSRQRAALCRGNPQRRAAAERDCCQDGFRARRPIAARSARPARSSARRSALAEPRRAVCAAVGGRHRVRCDRCHHAGRAPGTGSIFGGAWTAEAGGVLERCRRSVAGQSARGRGRARRCGRHPCRHVEAAGRRGGPAGRLRAAQLGRAHELPVAAGHRRDRGRALGQLRLLCGVCRTRKRRPGVGLRGLRLQWIQRRLRHRCIDQRAAVGCRCARGGGLSQLWRAHADAVLGRGPGDAADRPRRGAGCRLGVLHRREQRGGFRQRHRQTGRRRRESHRRRRRVFRRAVFPADRMRASIFSISTARVRPMRRRSRSPSLRSPPATSLPWWWSGISPT